VGGAISVDTVPHLKKIQKVHLTKFEKRKVVFAAQGLSNPAIDKALLLAVEFELLWLQNKQSYYNQISIEDNERIKMLNDRWKIL